jgi:uncharacterized membrane protein
MHLFGFILFKLIFTAFIITAFVMFIRRRKYGRSCATDPITILETRFVNGEITSEDYSRMREELVQSRKSRG